VCDHIAFSFVDHSFVIIIVITVQQYGVPWVGDVFNPLFGDLPAWR